jgi:1-hydroxycarotenoid 3,4-desaturase
MTGDKVVVIGAGIGGLVSAALLAARGLDVTVVEKEPAPGGKARMVRVGESEIDGGPTVFTLRDVFDHIFDACGSRLDAHCRVSQADILARHAWDGERRLDLFADPRASEAAIGDFAGVSAAEAFRVFMGEARHTFETLDKSFMRASKTNPLGLTWRIGLHRIGALYSIHPYTALWKALGHHFRDPRLRQLFGRYATYCGSSPFQAPATLMLVAHVEQEGVWSVGGGMHRLAVELARLAAEQGASFRYGAHVQAISVEGGRATGVTLGGSGERLAADAVVSNADVAALACGHLGAGVTGAVQPAAAAARSLSAVTWALAAEAEGFPLVRHNVFFSADYPAEFRDIFERHRLPQAPTVYACAQDRGGGGDDGDGAAPGGGPERLLLLVNAPPTGDSHSFEQAEMTSCEERTFGLLERCGLRLRRDPGTTVVTTPAGFERLFPATGGALYGRASHGWRASFERPTARSRVPGLYLAGGSAHPGPGVPMAALSGRLAAASLLSDLASSSRSRRTATSGGTSTR